MRQRPLTLYDVLGLKVKNSIMRSVVLGAYPNDRHANVRIMIEAYDQTYLNAYNTKGMDYILEQVGKQLKKKEVRENIAELLGLPAFTGALTTVYRNDNRPYEFYYIADGRTQYEAYNL